MGLQPRGFELCSADDTCFLLIARYDRTVEDGVIKRLHQEDMCQALGVLPRMKYEREGGPTIAACLELLQKHTSQPARDQQSFLVRLVFNFFDW